MEVEESEDLNIIEINGGPVPVYAGVTDSGDVYLRGDIHPLGSASALITAAAQHVLGEISPTEFLAAAEGYVCVRVNPETVTNATQGLAGVMRELGDLAMAVHEEAAPGAQVSPNGNRRVQHHVTELLGRINALGAFVSAQVPVRREG